ncbi:MAG: ATP-binding protein [Lysobacterales bacterium]
MLRNSGPAYAPTCLRAALAALWLASGAASLQAAAPTASTSPAALATPGDAGRDPVAAARALLAQAQHYRARGLWLQMEEVSERGRRLLDTVESAPPDLRIDLDLAWASAVQQQERADEAYAPLTEALERARQQQDPLRQARALVGLSSVHGRTGQFEQARAYATQAKAVAESAGNAEWQARALLNLALIARGQQQEALAAGYIQDALALPLQNEASDIQEQLLVAEASMARAAGDPARALAVARRAEDRARASGNTHLLGYALQNQGSAHCDAGDYAAADAAYARAADQYPEATLPADRSRILLAWSECLARAGQYEAAYRHQVDGRQLQARADEQRRSEVLEALNYAYQDQARQKALAEALSDSQRLQAELAEQRLRLTSGGLLLAVLLIAVLALSLRLRVLRSATRAAEAAQAARSDLLAVAGHEIRNPTQGLLSALAALRGASLTAAQFRALDTATHAAEVIARLSSDAFELALSETRPMTPRRRWVEADTLLQDALALIRPAASARGLSLSVDDDSARRRVDVDPERVLQALVNLLSNAVRYTERGSVRLKSRLIEEAPARWVIEVSDSGPGIPEADLPRIFDPYFRGSQGPRSHGGGLGLAVVSRIVGAHAGQIAARNRPEGGASFVMTLPSAIAPAIATDAAEQRPEQALAGQRLLLVDDDEDVRIGVAAMAELAGAHVAVAADSVDALTQLRAFDPDHVLIDQHLGQERGDQVLKLLKAASGGRRRRWVLATGSMNSEGMDPGFDRLLIKPYGVHELAAALRADGAPPAAEASGLTSGDSIR